MASSSSHDKKRTQPSSSYEAFNAVDKLVSKPVLGSDGAASWQKFRQETKTSRASVAPTAPLKKVDRSAGFRSWEEERQHESNVRRQAGDADLNAGYTVFRDKSAAEEAAKRKQAKRIEARIRPDDKPYYLPSKTFQGWKFDYIFTTKDRGTGYYWDGMDSVKKLRGELLNEQQDDASIETTDVMRKRKDNEADNKEQSDLQEQPQKKKKKRKKEGPVIIDNPNNPMEQVAAAIRRKQQQQASSSSLLLPQGWEIAVDPTTRKTYYFCRITGERQWEKPPSSSTNNKKLAEELPSGWSEAKDASSGKTYFFNAETGETRWERPTV